MKAREIKGLMEEKKPINIVGGDSKVSKQYARDCVKFNKGFNSALVLIGEKKIRVNKKALHEILCKDLELYDCKRVNALVKSLDFNLEKFIEVDNEK